MTVPNVDRGLKALRRRRQEEDDLVSAAEAIQNIGGIEQATTEAEGRLVTIQRRVVAEEAKLQDTEAAIQEAKKEIEHSHEVAKRKQDEANRTAAKILSDAEEKATEIKKSAKEAAQEVSKRLTTARQKLEEADAALAATDAKNEAMKAEMAKLRERLGA